MRHAIWSSSLFLSVSGEYNWKEEEKLALHNLGKKSLFWVASCVGYKISALCLQGDENLNVKKALFYFAKIAELGLFIVRTYF